jgi:bacillithiol synthase
LQRTDSKYVTKILSIPYSNLPGFSRSWQAVTAGSAPADLYARAAASVDACLAAAEETLRVQRPWKELADLFERSGRKYGVPGKTLARLSALAEGKAAMVVTGQQVGYLGGPFYTFLKAYHTTQLAQKLEQELRVPVLACFWLEGEDHDLEEVRNANYFSRDGELKTLRFSPKKEISGFPVGQYEVDANTHISELARDLDSPHDASVQLLRECYSQTTLSDGMGRLLARTLGDRGLFVIEGMESELKAMALPLWEKVIACGRGLTEILEERSTELRAGGWNTPLSPTRDAYPFYLCGNDHVRCSLGFDGLLKHPNGETETLTQELLISSAREQPSAVSPKAALRPLYQDFVLPTIAYVAGPGELDYHAQLAPFYNELAVPAPVLFPRLSATIMDQRAARAVEKLGVPLERLIAEDPAVLQRALIAGYDEGHTAEVFEDAKRRIEAVFAELKTALAAVDATLEGAAAASIGKALQPLEQLREKTQRALKQKHATALARLEKGLALLKPRDEFSERVLNSGYYLAQFGTERLLAALDELPMDAREHCVIGM